MATYETTVQYFRIKIWLVEPEEKASGYQWRGFIIHVPTGKKCNLKDLEGIIDFIAPYLESMGVKPDLPK